ncbi:S8 family serine peptidase [Roseimaritima ulvae]|uniref:Serine protease AprX n=1 Tax=Roseimaritima ulvae TaxID=980254 RepID=A0A5B9QWN9_9BACT|nr:S8 family serine peptidase [Roseimaritima ulvae]QEG43464.1 Serine protease AprX [Roseimaritima ulvae]
MANKLRPEIDSFLFHLVGDEDSVAAKEADLQARQQRDLTSRETVDLRYLEPPDDEPLREILYNVTPRDIDVDRVRRIIEDAQREEDVERAEAVEPTPNYQRGIPVLIEARPGWSGEGVAGFRRGTSLGNFVTGHAHVAAIRALSTDPDVIRLEISRDAGHSDLNESVSAVRGDRVHTATHPEKGANAIVGVIDSGLDVLHECFLDEQGNTRIIALWDQTDPSQSGPPGDDGQPMYGKLYKQSDIERIVSNGVEPPELGRDGEGHGTHVTSIAAGRKVGAFAGGLAPEAKLLFVKPKLDTPLGDPNSIGYSVAHVDALSFMDQTATNEGLPLVVNLSLGMNAGAHDGTSTLEAAFDRFTGGGRLPGRVLVKSAGNAAENRLHARFQVGTEQVVHLQWKSRSMRRKADLIEVWFHSADDLHFSLIAPGNSGTTPKIHHDLGAAAINGQFTSRNEYSMTLDRFHRDNGDARLSIRITRGDARRIEIGTWSLRVQAKAVLSSGNVDAWIERDDKRPIGFENHVSTDGTLSIPGTANTVISVAALDRKMEGQVMMFSSRGSTRDGRQRPDIGAPGNKIEAAQSTTASGVVSKQGTSMAAPHVAGAIALLLSKLEGSNPGVWLNANQIRAALSQSSRGFNGHWNSARGWGMLDTDSLLSLFDD